MTTRQELKMDYEKGMTEFVGGGKTITLAEIQDYFGIQNSQKVRKIIKNAKYIKMKTHHYFISDVAEGFAENTEIPKANHIEYEIPTKKIA